MEIAQSFEKVSYKSLNSKQKELYNFQKISSVLAEYGFNCIKLADDWKGTDFLACHFNGESLIKIQLKGCLGFDKKYVGKGLHIAFLDGGQWYVYPHDEFLEEVSKDCVFTSNDSWKVKGSVWWTKPTKYFSEKLKRYKI